MIELIFNSPDLATLQSDAVSLGFVDSNGNMLTSGPTKDGGGFFLNIVGTIPAQSGIWGRLRVNGSAQYFPTFSSTITQYHYDATLGGWTTDGTTLAPSWVGNVGVIA